MTTNYETIIERATNYIAETRNGEWDAWRKIIRTAIAEALAARDAAAEPVAWRELAYANLGAVRDHMQPWHVTAVQDWLRGVYPDSAPVAAAQEGEA